MQSGSVRRRIIAVLLASLLFPVLGAEATAQVSPDTSDTECRTSPSTCVFGGLLVAFAAPYTSLFSDLRATYEPGKRSVLGVRLEHRFRSLGGSDEHTHPYLGVGFLLAYERHETGLASTGGRFKTEADLETALGSQWALAPLLSRITAWNPPVVATTEVQWRPFRESDRVRAEVGPGLSLSLSSDHRLRVHIPVSFPLDRRKREGVRFGVGVVYNWK
jgi:hypothetical protein